MGQCQNLARSIVLEQNEFLTWNIKKEPVIILLITVGVIITHQYKIKIKNTTVNCSITY